MVKAPTARRNPRARAREDLPRPCQAARFRRPLSVPHVYSNACRYVPISRSGSARRPPAICVDHPAIPSYPPRRVHALYLPSHSSRVRRLISLLPRFRAFRNRRRLNRAIRAGLSEGGSRIASHRYLFISALPNRLYEICGSVMLCLAGRLINPDLSPRHHSLR